MLPSLAFLKHQLEGILRNKFAQGHQTSGYLARLEQQPALCSGFISVRIAWIVPPFHQLL
ncbi:hypothetical protein BK146_10135 [Paenibacillus sp. FSL R7-0333]|nr:hypothetical protein BK146_10135 [Paenibacillus sp. FSL R7-0333]